jgi:hypothetical protein
MSCINGVWLCVGTRQDHGDCGLARYHARAGRRVRVFKTGPDFIDPMILEAASAAPSTTSIAGWWALKPRERCLPRRRKPI